MARHGTTRTLTCVRTKLFLLRHCHARRQRKCQSAANDRAHEGVTANGPRCAWSYGSRADIAGHFCT
eukprot:1173907-Prorocentrum_lima.AAC.1